MTSTLTALYENGVLRPLQPVLLRERQKVRIRLLLDDPHDASEQVLQDLLASGAHTSPPGHSDVKPSLIFVSADDKLVSVDQTESLVADNPNLHPT